MNTFAPDFSSNNGIYNPNGGIPNTNAPVFDPSMFGNQNIDVNRLQNTPMNGTLSPAFPNQSSYQVNQVIPSKRPRASEDNTGASPRPGSRSQTPQMAYPGFQGNQLQAHNSFQHLQQTSSQNATPSPTMQNQQFRPPGAPPQRVNTVSPNPNPYPQQNMGMSPHNNGPNPRVGTPQSHNMGQMGQMGGMNFMPGTSIPPGFNQNFGAGGGNMSQGMPQNMPVLPAHLANKSMDIQRQYQMRMAQQQQQQQQPPMAPNNMGQQRPPGAMTPMFGAQGHAQVMPPGAARPNQQNMPSPQNTQTFLRTAAGINSQQGRPFNPSPLVSGQAINLMKLYSSVMKHQGSAVVTQSNAWGQIALMMGFPPQTFPSAPQELKFAFEQNLGTYEVMYMAKMQMQGRGQGQPNQMPGATRPPQMSPTRPPMPGTPQNAQQQQAQYLQHLQRTQNTQQEQGTPVRNVPPPSANGWSTPQPDQNAARQQNPLAQQHQRSMSRQLDATPPHGQVPGFPTPSPGPDAKTFDRAPTSEPVGPLPPNGVQSDLNIKLDHGTEYQTKVKILADTHGGVPVDEAGKIGEEIARLKADVPLVDEMGLIDIRSLSLSIQSGIHAEMRVALDYLARITSDPRLSIELERSEDLIDVLIDCAEEQVETLADGNPEVSDIIDLNSYEDVLRHCRQEIGSLLDVPKYGSVEHDLDRAADRLLAITVILRNLSFFEFNHKALSDANVVKFISNTIRLIGTRILLLRTHNNTCDFMKDIITFLSNTTHAIHLPSRDDALNILQFLLTFAPCPPPTTPISFTPYDPLIHKYLPAAVDCLAELLARDDPNRAFYKAIFSQDSASTPPYDLLTRAFALAISVVPDRTNKNLIPLLEIRISEARKPYLTQGMLAADILASLAPGAESGVARSWLEAEDGWAMSLVRFAFLLLSDPGQPPPGPPPGHRGPHHGRQEMPDTGFHQITHRAINMMKRLAEKCAPEDNIAPAPQEEGDEQDHENDNEHDEKQNGEVGGKEEKSVNGVSSKPASHRELKYSGGLVPKIETLMGALLMNQVDGAGLSKLVKFGDLLD